ncbi:ferredoxin--NADP(+) reductase [Enterobacteriaceae bacterium ET-AT1-13]|nr:ferredoxin--NADP(+) reductase [Enterobacteriaceae bacterium ET-AT1-13]WGS66487.1 ferredoxin--NADP(+) reductase [Enterobacteriaceae bacterium Cmel17]WMC17511.1 MAG: ferredoxin--NADP(+) reductase [Enterobacteriaceae bacterium Cmel21]WMC17718.1 MAG: ferredoxin--NADP(+) reductase [Enterobacteriaceae bacterium PSmelAO3-2]WMC17922.1 MAG: ferredoxin--NADP(+) reductase [Enterobacteriaceae bacterium PSmelAO3-1]WMC18125.1 MAG: ferredoxin--NADP(+) reductase [Enterobacteriaceae bacterium PSmelAO1]
MDNWVIGKVVNIEKYSNKLFKIFIKAYINNFISGQFTKIAIIKKKKIIQRAYSFVNASNNLILEFYILFISHGKLSRELFNLKINSKLLISRKSFGFFILKEIPYCEILWMFSSGTGVGPYLSILRENKNLERFKNLVLIHSNKFIKNCNYNSVIKNLRDNYYGKLRVLNIISQENIYGALKGRINNLIYNGILEKTIGLGLDYRKSHVMICGNPLMIKSTKEILIKLRNMKKHLHYIKGNITFERYW